MRKNDYWVRRTLQSEDKANRLAKSAAKRTAAAYKDLYETIENDIAQLFMELRQDGIDSITRTDLWRYAKYRQLRADIMKAGNIINTNQSSLLDETLRDVFKQTIGRDIDKAFNYINEDEITTIINEDWKGSNYSNKVWNNTNNLVQRLQKDITDMVVLGKNPNDIRKQVKTDLNVSSRVADRLIRTESQHIFNVASVRRYEKAGVRKVRYIAEEDSDQWNCDCYELKDQEFEIGTEPELPRHPNCRCCYAPVVEFDNETLDNVG